MGRNTPERGGINMIERLLKLTARDGWIFLLRILGVVLLIIGILAAALDMSFRGFTPVYWVLLALASFLGVVCNSLFRIVLQLEKKAQD
jgi:uncharacterized membrane protein YiaA